MTDAGRLRPRPSSTGVPIRHGRLARRGPFAAVAVSLLVTLGVLVVSGGALTAVAAWDITTSVKPGVHLNHMASGSGQTDAPDLSAITGGVNLLLTGTDTRTGQGAAYSSKADLAGSSGTGNNDVTMLLHISQDHRSVSVVSFPRDLMLAIPACPLPDGGTAGASSRMILNSTLARGGLSCVVLSIEQLTGLQIPYAAEISFEGVTAMSDAVGGVTVCVATPINDLYTNPPLHLESGQHTIIGDEALSFLRSRHGVGDGSDLGRISNQQVFMAALARKVENGGVLGNPLTLFSLAKAATTNMVLSDTLTNPSTLVQIALALKDTGLANMVFLQYPTVADPKDPNRVVPQKAGAEILNAALVGDQPLQLSGLPGRGAVAPTPSAEPTAAPDSGGTPTASSGPTTGATPTASAPPSATPVPANEAVLPPIITGQTAAEQTCSKGS